MKLAVLYAGQGAQHPGMGKEFYEASSAFRAAFDAADLPFDLHRVCFDDPDGVLNQTEYTQPCMVAFACGVSAVLAEQGIKPAYVAGLSLRRMRLTARQTPLKGPCFLMASTAYCEQVGVKRHEGPIMGNSTDNHCCMIIKA